MFLPDPFSLTWKKNEYAFNKYKIIISVSYTIFNFLKEFTRQDLDSIEIQGVT